MLQRPEKQPNLHNHALGSPDKMMPSARSFQKSQNLRVGGRQVGCLQFESSNDVCQTKWSTKDPCDQDSLNTYRLLLLGRPESPSSCRRVLSGSMILASARLVSRIARRHHAMVAAWSLTMNTASCLLSQSLNILPKAVVTAALLRESRR